MRVASAAIKLLYREPLAGVGTAIYAVIVTMALFAPQIAPYDPRVILRQGRRIARYLPVSGEHWLGTTAGGHDVLSQLIYGARAALEVGLTAAIAVVAIGTLLGLLAGYLGGWVDKGSPASPTSRWGCRSCPLCWCSPHSRHQARVW